MSEHTDGCPMQEYPWTTLHYLHPGCELYPASHVSLPATTPSPQIATQTPLFRLYPLEQVVQVLLFVQEAQLAEQFRHFWALLS